MHALSVPAATERSALDSAVDADAVEIRVLGCLIEKQRTTPDTYPLTLNALRLACNQATNRDPVVDYDEETIREALQRLWRKEWARLASGQGSRAVKYRQLVQDTLGLADDEISVLCVLMLRGPQTPGRAEAAHRPPAPVRRPRRGGGDARAADRARARRAPRPAARAEGGALRAAARRRVRRLRRDVDVPRPVLARDPLEERVAALEAEVAALRAVLSRPGSSLRGF